MYWYTVGHLIGAVSGFELGTMYHLNSELGIVYHPRKCTGIF